jgi:enoyl-CoA hydratase/carnithine racemase
MSFVGIERNEAVAIMRLSRGKVNALNEEFVDELQEKLLKLREDQDTRAIILTGQGKFFSFGFDIPEFLGYSKESFLGYLRKFSSLHSLLFFYPKPVIAALNGHTMAGGCMLAFACDHRIMVSGKAKIALNEISFGSSVFAGSVEMLKHCVGTLAAEQILLSGAMYSAEEALNLGLVNRVVQEDELQEEALSVARDYAAKSGPAFASIKKLLRGPVAEVIGKREEESLLKFVDIWYSEATWKNLQQIKIA